MAWYLLIYSNRKIIIEVFCILAVCFALWHIKRTYAKVTIQQAEIASLKANLKAGENAIILLENIQAGKTRIDHNTRENISELRKIVFANHSSFVFLPNGRMLQP